MKKDVGPSRGLPVYANFAQGCDTRDSRAVAVSAARGWAEGIFNDYQDAAHVRIYGPVRLDQPREDGDPFEVIDRPDMPARRKQEAA